MNLTRPLGGLVAATLLLGLYGCTPGTAEHWLVTESGDISFASCQQFTIDALTVTSRVNEGKQQVIELSGPEVFFGDGESFDLASVAEGWNAAEQLDMAADWYDLRLEGSNNGRQTLLTYVDRVDLSVGEWTQVPQSGIGIVDCERL